MSIYFFFPHQLLVISRKKILWRNANDDNSTMQNTFDDQNVEFHDEIRSNVLKRRQEIFCRLHVTH